MPRTKHAVRSRSAQVVAVLVTSAALVATSVPAAVADDPNPHLGFSQVAPSQTPSPAPAQRSAQPRPSGFGFKLATFNVLGSQHTRGPGGFAPGTKRARLTARAMKHKGVDVIGMQEVQRDQFRVLHNRLPGFGIWPGTRLGNQGIRLQIAYSQKLFRRVDAGRIMTRFDRLVRPIPWVKLRNRDTGRRIYVVNIHNSPRGLESERDSATRSEIELINRLRRRGVPVFVTGDMNEKSEWFCKVTARTDLRASNGGRAGARRCIPPARRLRIDWIMGGRRIEFSHYREDRGERVRQISDHEFVHTRVRVLPRR